MQNTSHAVMSQRTESTDSLDNFPTPPWATRALIEQLIGPAATSELSCLEPACGQGHMAKVLWEYFGKVTASDIFDYGYGEVVDFLKKDYTEDQFDWVITNPPFRMAEDFIWEALRVSHIGVAMLTRTVFIESIGRYDRLFSRKPPTTFAQFTERVPMVKGRLDKKASTATGYSWIIWRHDAAQAKQLEWIAPCRKQLERAADYNNHVPRPHPKRPEQKDLFDVGSGSSGATAAGY
jgi:hypothetical protein